MGAPFVLAFSGYLLLASQSDPFALIAHTAAAFLVTIGASTFFTLLFLALRPSMDGIRWPWDRACSGLLRRLSGSWPYLAQELSFELRKPAWPLTMLGVLLMGSLAITSIPKRSTLLMATSAVPLQLIFWAYFSMVRREQVSLVRVIAANIRRMVWTKAAFLMAMGSVVMLTFLSVARLTTGLDHNQLQAVVVTGFYTTALCTAAGLWLDTFFRENAQRLSGHQGGLVLAMLLYSLAEFPAIISIAPLIRKNPSPDLAPLVLSASLSVTMLGSYLFLAWTIRRLERVDIHAKRP